MNPWHIEIPRLGSGQLDVEEETRIGWQSREHVHGQGWVLRGEKVTRRGHQRRAFEVGAGLTMKPSLALVSARGQRERR